jgi:tRNA threonylcarbamoyladenosine biosynthesis protein TsaB
MLLLGIDTATRRVGVVLANERGMLGRVEIGGTGDEGPPRHAETLAPAIAWCCEQCGVAPSQLSAVAVGIGPGMFTGLRVGVTTAKVLAQSLRVPVVPVSSLDLLAYPLRHASGLVVATIDARRNELYWAVYRPVPGGVQRTSAYELGSPDDLVAELQARGEDALLCGDGVLRFPQAFEGLGRRVAFAGPAHASPSVAALAELATARYQREEFEPPAEVLPMYLRQSDAEIEWERRVADGHGSPRGLRAGRVRGADAATAPAQRRAHRNPGISAAVVPLAVRERAGVAFVACVSGCESGARARRVCGLDDVAHRRAHHDDRGRPGVAA